MRHNTGRHHGRLDRVGDPETAKFNEWTPVLDLAEKVYAIARALVA